MREDKNISALQQALQESRQMIALQHAGLHEELDVAARLRHSIQRKPWAWLGGALLAGGMTTFLKGHSSPKKINVAGDTKKPSSVDSKKVAAASLLLGESAFAAGALQLGRFLFPLIKPALMTYVTRKISDLSQDKKKNY
ncbi:MAG: hypothetical protein ACH346_08275 [Chthoniobacterales bacterium]